jgi:hypothetical protein
MAKRIMDKDNRELIASTEEGRAFLEYFDRFDTEPYGHCIGFPYVEDTIALHRECIKQGKTWEKLLGFEHAPEDAVI